MNPIISKLLAHKAALMMTAAMGGVVMTSILAVKDSKKHEKEVRKCCAEFPDEDIKEEPETVDEFYKVNVPKKEKAIIFAKSYWRTGLSMAVTFGLMILSHHSMVKEIAGLSAALGIMSTKYKELDATLKEKYPDAYKKIHKIIDRRNLSLLENKKLIKEETYDGRLKYYDTFTNQIFFATELQMSEAKSDINERLVNEGLATYTDFLASFPKSSGIKIPSWTKHVGWYTGCTPECLETTYEYNMAFFGPFVKPLIEKETIIFEGEKIEVNAIRWEHCPDFDPTLSGEEMLKIEGCLA